ncbi:hypothetical protein D3C73_1482010 [compost metagenome]
MQRAEQGDEVAHLLVDADQIALVADGLRKLEAETEAVRYRIAPASHRVRGRRGVEGGIAFHRVEDLGIVGEVVGGLGTHAQ